LKIALLTTNNASSQLIYESTPTHSRSLTTSGVEWILSWHILMCLHILSLPALWRASSWNITLCRRRQFREGGLGVIVY